MSYIGRFAPSPSGPLHFGSLISALGSFFQARAKNGKWLVRIEDIDPPREMPGADQIILEQLDGYGLHWDGEVLYQSQQSHRYQEQVDIWIRQKKAYYCQCTRQQIKQNGGYYLGHCRFKQDQINPSKPASIRLHLDNPVFAFEDLHYGFIKVPKTLAHEDLIIKRKDGLFAYNLAVVLDDIEQGITEVVRGADLIEPSVRQMSLYHQLQKPCVQYLHLPLALDSNGNKLSKQNHAPAIQLNQAKQNLCKAMVFLGFNLPQDIQSGSIKQILDWGIQHWDIQQLTTKR